MKRITKIAIISLGAVAVIGSLSACHRSPEDRAEHMVERVSSKLDLNATQQAKLKTLSDEMLSTRKAMRSQFGDSREQLLAIFEQPKLDQDKMLGMIKSHTDTINQRAPKIVAAMGDFYDSLTPEQQAEIREFMQKHDRHHGPMGHHHKDDTDK